MDLRPAKKPVAKVAAKPKAQVSAKAKAQNDKMKARCIENRIKIGSKGLFCILKMSF